ncbi:Uncharacterised protein [Klebsiella pneumoniae]|nr:hypothetical protein PAERUG_P54_1_London_24_VIM_2_04_13_03878 [Pseudomonas aeruginosa]SST09126.1 Uncharacterised protein [Acinetobacter baumannii]SVJ78697.1 Uncharacterised protein [Klebsiella pneumoniae]
MPPNTLEALSAFIAFDRFSMRPSSFTRCARWATPMRVPAVSNMCTKRKARITLIMVTLNAPAMSIARKVGARLGGAENTPPYCTRPRAQPTRVTLRMLMRMPPNTRRYSSTAIIRKHSAASSGPGEVRWPSLIRVAGLATTMPAVFRPIRPRNRPTPAPMANLRLRGMLLSSHSRTREKVSSMNITPEMNTAPRAICQL